MKTIIDSNSELIIRHEAYPISKDEKGKIIWLDEKKTLTNVKNRINGITIYSLTAINEYGATHISTIQLSENDIEKLYNKIQELKNTEYIGEIQDDDLPF